MIRVGIADEHAIIRVGIRSALELAGGFDIVGEASDGDGTLRLVTHSSPDILTLGLAMSGLRGEHLIREIRRSVQSPKVLVVTKYSAPGVARECLAAGASGFVTKNSPAHELIAALRKIAGGGVYINLSGRIETQVDAATSRGLPHERLTATEMRIFQRIACGQSGVEIATTMDISQKTVSTHRANIIRKMELRNDIDLIRYAIAYKLVPDDDP
ncbi:response regulator transcription factor [Paraburkholderia tropica]|uniref:response regulator transcription factor n=1 Tax=Paraburkholderia tropica TaxID=92647 RepID=UPI002AB0F432|nr:response regulator transcription factor [Paraburkholderia tropica]